MKKELFQITKDLAQDKITEQEARTLLLCLLGVSKRLILENLRERMQGVHPEYYLSIIDDEIEGLNGC